MEITVPQEQANLDLIRNRITMAEGELQRLKDLQVSVKYTINELVKEKKWHEEEIESFKEQKNNLVNQIEVLQTELTEANEVINKATSVKTAIGEKQRELDKNKQSHLDQVTVKEAEHAKKDKELGVKKSEYAKILEDVKTKQKQLLLKEEKMNRLVSELNDDFNGRD